MKTGPDRWNLTVNAFEFCCQQGCLNEIVLDQVVQHLIPTPEQGRALLKDYWSDANGNDGQVQVQVSDLPKEWTRRAMRNRKSKKRTKATTIE
jgi:hypothetical protein